MSSCRTSNARLVFRVVSWSQVFVAVFGVVPLFCCAGAPAHDTHNFTAPTVASDSKAVPITSKRSLASKTPIDVAVFIPFSGGWTAGFGMWPAVEMMVEGINRNPDLLPDHELRPIYQDSGCDRGPALRLFLKNQFDSLYEKVTIDPLNMSVSKENVVRNIVAMVGPGCSGPAQEIAAFNGAARLPMISPSATSPLLNDRVKYPHFIRTMADDSLLLTVMCHLCLALGHIRVAVVTGELRRFYQWNGHLASVIAELGLDSTSMPAGTIEGHDGTAYFYEMLQDTKAHADAAVAAILASGVRVVMMPCYALQLKLATCSAWQKGLHKAVWMGLGWLQQGWWQVPEAGVECSLDEMSIVNSYTVAVSVELWSTNSGAPHSCLPGMTIGEFKDEYHNVRAFPGELRTEASSAADAVCLIALSLHELMITPKPPYSRLSLSDLTKQTESTFTRVMDTWQTTSFDGVSGKVYWKPEDPNPVQTVVILQYQEENFGTRDLTTVAGVRDGVISWRRPFQFWGDSYFPAGEDLLGALNASVPQFTTCPAGQKLLTDSNTCQPCAAGTEFSPTAGTCVPCKAGTVRPADSATSTCTSCSPGTFQAEEGQATCVPCVAGSYCPAFGGAKPIICPPGKFCIAASSEVEACPVGSFGSHAGSSNASGCEPCRAGTAASRPGAVSCDACPEGTFSEGGLTASMCRPCPLSSWAPNTSKSCTNCPTAFVTLRTQALSPEYCTCPQGAIWLPDGAPLPDGSAAPQTGHGLGRCVPCGPSEVDPEGEFYTGMVCPGGFACKSVAGKRLVDNLVCEDVCVAGPEVCLTQCVVPLQEARRLCESPRFMRDCDGWSVRSSPMLLDRLDASDSSGQTGRMYSWANVAILGRVTIPPGSTAQQEAVAAAGWTFFPQLKHCPDPSQAMHQPPLVRQGFYLTHAELLSEKADLRIVANRSEFATFDAAGLAIPFPATKALSVFRCMNPKACPGGPPDTCFPGDGGLACSLCADNHYTTQAGCAQCLGQTGTSTVVMFVMLIVVEVGFVLLYTLTDHALSTKVAATVATVLALSNTINGLQTFSVFSMISITWPPPLGDALDMLKVFMLDLDALQWECVASVTSVGKFSVKLLTPAFVAGSYLTLLLLAKAWARTRGKGVSLMTLPHTVNCVGVVFQMLFISICLGLIVPFKCRMNPSGLMTLFDFPSVACGDAEHGALTTLGGVFLALYPGVFFAACGYVIRILPELSMKNRDALRYVKFLVGRFRPDRYYFGMFFLARNLLLGIAPLVDPGNAVLQCVALGVVLATALILQLLLWPWAVPAVNWLDTFSLCCFIIAVIGAAGLSGAATDNGLSATAAPVVTVITITFIAIFASMFIVVSLAATTVVVERRTGRPWNTKGYQSKRNAVATDLMCICQSVSSWKPTSLQEFVDSLSSFDFDMLRSTVDMILTGADLESTTEGTTGTLRTRSTRLTVSRVMAKRRSSAAANSAPVMHHETEAVASTSGVGGISDTNSEEDSCEV